MSGVEIPEKGQHPGKPGKTWHFTSIQFLEKQNVGTLKTFLAGVLSKLFLIYRVTAWCPILEPPNFLCGKLQH